MDNDLKPVEEDDLSRERSRALEQLEDWLEGPVLVLGFAWLALLVIELIWGLNPLLEIAVYVIWGIFVVDFSVRFLLAPDKTHFLRANWLTLLSLLLPALRVFRIFRIARAARLLRLTRTARGLRFVRVVSSLNRGMRVLRGSLGRRGFGYVMLLSVVITLVGAAGMFAFENAAEIENGLMDYGDAVWWTAMIMTTLGSEYWPKTVEGRLLGFLLSLYALGVFGYITATLATFFIGQDAASRDGELAGEEAVRALQAEIQALRQELANRQNHGG